VIIRLKSDKTKFLSSNDHHTLLNALHTATLKYAEDAAMFVNIVKQGGIENFMTADAAKRMAQQFNRQVEDANRLVSLIEDAIQIILDHNEDDY
jgi:hypothetical protein